MSLKSLLLPKGERPRTVPAGLGRGLRLLVDFKYDTAFFFGRYERELTPHYRKLVPGSKLVFDVGAYRGWDTAIFAKLSDAKIVAFEAVPKFAEFTERSMAVCGVEVAMELGFVSDGVKQGEKTIDAAAERYGYPDFIKMDIEGAEASALRGATQVLSHKPKLLIEVYGQVVEDECKQILGALDYDIEMVDQARGLLRENRTPGHNRWLIAQPR